ncbi:hypothetical protein BO94DRAFT_143225 [Aspergillus sclerotioniger CBS 115572]|uniref:Uncharacterized protein n=1 Tax=Aspergillus sclerotioniger CBS 115572 TaxID=1450535 RepID=A0A317XE46_9EURO|nr:hypothetical protein BO94DRAFT_143225 [Aspergillus sclerotioniger CBS 115572]PWY96022.1 hypothetical protein BO94DRAFT_143225 [Aspergillus sclerotioniger CBS 115572]
MVPYGPRAHTHQRLRWRWKLGHHKHYVNADPAKVIPKLTGEANFWQWSEALDWFLKTKDPVHSLLITGKYKRPTRPVLHLMDAHDNLRAVVAVVHNIRLDEVTAALLDEEIKTRTERNITLMADYRSEADKWDRINSGTVLIIRLTRDRWPLQRIASIKNAHEIM